MMKEISIHYAEYHKRYYKQYYNPVTENAPSTDDHIDVSSTTTVDDENINPLLGQEEDIPSI
jgi:hypothetical protein